MIDNSGNSFSSHADRVKILKAHYEELASKLDKYFFDELWKEELSNYSVKYFEALPFCDSHSNGALDQTITLAAISHVVKAIKDKKSARLDVIFGELIQYGGKLMC